MMNVVYKKEYTIAAGTEGAILKTLVYFSLFNYPLTKAEIASYMPPGTCTELFDDAMEQLVQDGIIFCIGGFYLTEDDPLFVKRRREGNQQAEELLPKAMKIGRFLASFPYVRGVGISGSLSKKYADERTDIDFFIITRNNRLWIARTLMHLFKKVTFLAGRQHDYCMNYYIDESALKLDDRDIYTAIETATLLPVYGNTMDDFFAANEWVGDWFAGYRAAISGKKEKDKRGVIKQIMEWLLNNPAGNWLDDQLMKISTRRWQKKKQKGKRNEQGKQMDLVTDKHFARSNPGMFREKLLAVYQEKLNGIKEKYPFYFRPSS
ncbi:MAG: hypothetical protein JNK14_02620 [Chitinophagaceae bacterium]|nr:hypothetical protein [Chitinophagaceae bacterium]